LLEKERKREKATNAAADLKAAEDLRNPATNVPAPPALPLAPLQPIDRQPTDPGYTKETEGQPTVQETRAEDAEVAEEDQIIDSPPTSPRKVNSGVKENEHYRENRHQTCTPA
jgi:hypothetical protein